MERRESQRHQLAMGAGKPTNRSTSEGPSSPKKSKLTTQVASEASGKQKGSFSPMVAIPTQDSRSLSCYTVYDKWTFPGSCVFHKSPLLAANTIYSLSYLMLWHLHPSTHTYTHTHGLTPETETERLRYAVFHDLWLKGNYLTSGLKYGGDYLVYRDSPSRVHSDFIAVVFPWKQPIGSIVSLGRLGSKVKKNTLLCSIERESGPVSYVTLQWSGMAWWNPGHAVGVHVCAITMDGGIVLCLTEMQYVKITI